MLHRIDTDPRTEFGEFDADFGLSAYMDTAEPGTWITLVRAVDERGKSLPLEPFQDQLTRWPGHDRSNYTGFLPLRGGEKKLTLTFALQKTRFVEFLAKPTHVIPPPRTQPASE